MKLLIEDYPYPASLVQSLVGEEECCETEGVCRIGKVGYFYNPSINDCVFVLPKVILDYHNEDCEDTVFGEFKPIDIIDIDKALREEKLNETQREFIYNLSIWIYRAIAEFAKINAALPENERSNIVFRKCFSQMDINGKNIDGTRLDIILSLIKFANENRDYFMFIIKNIHSGYNKIHWNRTIATKTAFVRQETPYYIETVNKKKQINFDEELLIIFYSILNYVKVKYGFPIHTALNYELISGQKFESYIAGLGKSRLLQLRYKYFSDKALKLWKLCYAFFAIQEEITSNTNDSDYLFVSNFNIVFETMIDSIISDKNIPNALRNQRDGKIVDHIYSDVSLITPNKIYYIGDSKYYKIGGSVHGNSEYKQYTYARNVIQYNLDLFVKHQKVGALPYVDTITDGYNVTPNFFISAEINENYSYENDGIREHQSKDGKNFAISKHFRNRLFDRDTLLLAHYDINFLYVLALFVSPYQSVREEMKKDIRNRFREHFIRMLKDRYNFYRFNIASENIEGFVTIHFRELCGKIYHFDGKLILALEKGEEDSQIIYEHYEPLLFPYVIE